MKTAILGSNLIKDNNSQIIDTVAEAVLPIETKGFWCYTCSGFNKNISYHSITNNPKCIQGQFDDSNLTSFYSLVVHSPMCYMITIQSGKLITNY